MSTIASTNIKHPSSATNNITLASTGAVAVNGAMTGAGLDLITSQTFSAVSSISVNNCFSNAYSNYGIELNIDSIASGAGVSMRLRSSGTDLSTGYYGTGWQSVFTSTLTGDPTSNGSSFWILTSGSPVSAQCFIFNPYRTIQTQASFLSMGNERVAQYSYTTTSTAQYDGFSIVTSQVSSGSIRVYGYKNS